MGIYMYVYVSLYVCNLGLRECVCLTYRHTNRSNIYWSCDESVRVITRNIKTGRLSRRQSGVEHSMKGTL